MSKPALRNPDLWREQAYIDGSWSGADSGATTAVHNPATGQRLGTVPRMGTLETRRAIDAANAAWPDWRRQTAKERSAILRRWYELIMQNADDLALLMTLEQGKPLAESLGEVAYGAAFIEWFSEQAKRVAGETLASPWRDRRLLVSKEPIGVCAAITPWNFPIAMITRKAGPALAAGCTMVLKPSEATPYCALALAALAQRAGMPPGVFNVVTGASREIGAEMTANPLVRKLSFTGSTEVGRALMAQSAPTIKKLSLELRQRALHRVRRCRSGRGRGRRHRLQIPQRRSNLRVRQPLVRAGRGLRAVRRKTGGRRRQAARGQRHRQRRDARSADQRTGGAKGRAARGRCAGQGRPSAHRRQTPSAGPRLLPADGDRRRRAGYAGGQGGNLRPAGATVPFPDRRGSTGLGQRHRIRTGQLFLLAGHRPDLARGRGTGDRHGGRQYRLDFQ